MKLTKLSKILIGIFSCLAIYGIIYFILSIYIVYNNEAILNTKTGKIFDSPGFAIHSYNSHIKFIKYNNVLTGTLPVILKCGENRFFKFNIYISYDYEWIQKNKTLPSLLIIPTGEIENYMLIETLKLNQDEFSPITLKELIYNFYANKLNNDPILITSFNICLNKHI